MEPISSFDYSGGRIFGGGSSINGEQYVRPTSITMSKWELSTEDSDWSPKSAIKAFKHLENYNGNTNNRKARGFSGPIDIREVGFTEAGADLVEAVATAHNSKGGLPKPELTDYNNPETIYGGFNRFQVFQKPSGNRESAATSMLNKEVLARKNLKLSLRSTVTRVIFEGKKAIGVEYIKDGACKKVYARKLVILSAGPRSATILQQSGIGNSYQLCKIGINTVYNNPNVGHNMLNHLVNTVVLTSDAKPSKDPNNLYTGGAFLPDPLLPKTELGRSVELIGNPAPGFLIIAILMNQLGSEGYALIPSKDPLAPILASDEALKDPVDLDTFVACYRRQIVPIVKQLHKINPAYNLVSPTFEVINDTIALKEYIKTNLAQAFHWQSQCRIGDVKHGVVDTNGYVHGVKHLIVADNSIAPVKVDANMASVAFMIGYIISGKLLRKFKQETECC